MISYLTQLIAATLWHPASRLTIYLHYRHISRWNRRDFIAGALFGASIFIVLGASFVLRELQVYPNGNAVTMGAIDATSAPGSDMCAKIAQAATDLAATNPAATQGGIVDARGFTGVQTCANSMFNGWPTTASGAWPAQVLLGAVAIQTNVTTVVPSNVYIYGMGRGNTPSNTGTANGNATTFQVGANFPNASSAVTFNGTSTFTWTVNPGASNYVNGQQIQLSGTAAPTGYTLGAYYYVVGAGTGTFQLSLTLGGAAITGSGTGTAMVATTRTPVLALGSTGSQVDNFSIQLRDLGVACENPSGSDVAGGIGVENVSSQQGTLVNNLFIWGCWTGVLVAQKGDDAQEWRNLYIKDDTLAVGVNFHCLEVGQVNEQNAKDKALVFDTFSCEVHHSTATNEAVQINGSNVSLRNMYFEYNTANVNDVSYVSVNTVGTGGSNVGQVMIDGINCVNNPGTNNTAKNMYCVRIGTSNNMFGVTAQRISWEGGTSGSTGNWGPLIDTGTNGCTVNASTQGPLQLYITSGSFGGGQPVMSTGGGCTWTTNQPHTFSNASINMTGLPASAGAGGLFVCVDSTGKFYKKSTCP